MEVSGDITLLRRRVIFGYFDVMPRGIRFKESEDMLEGFT
jgi:hypothetical protein